MIASNISRVCKIFGNVVSSLSGTKTYGIGKMQILRHSSRVTHPNPCSYQHRSHTCGQLRALDDGRTVTLCGWLQFKRMGKFFTLRDGYGVTQLFLPEQDPALAQKVEALPLESVLQVTGAVRRRPDGQQNQQMTTGDVEVVVHDVAILNKPDRKLPFNIRSFNKAKEALRLQYRYLDLRHPELQHNIRLRSQMVMDMREYLARDHGFIDVETPTLFKRTPGGAQEFVVPTRTAGRFYSLVQSPQQFKQLLVMGGLDRYFQIARCYRDEGARPDRQPEFTQVDIELGFTTQLGIQSLVEGLLRRCWPLGDLVTPFPRITYAQAIAQYGSDKPDLRFGWKLTDVTSTLRACGSELLERELAAPGAAAVALVVPDGSCHFSRSLRAQHAVRALIGRLRVQMADRLEASGVAVRQAGPHLVWVVDFPLFVEEEGRLVSAHHPFTRPHQEDEHLVHSNPSEARSQHFDLVLDGWEIGGGSMRIHEPALQRHVLETVLGEDTAPLQHLLDALASGAPPHGGIALGLDRLVALVCGAQSIRDVIAFPKTSDGRDLMADAPSDISREEYDLYHLTKPS
ncbi:aspartate--tRNA ligase, mitochondrial-like [Pollicipes pollicipes]|uniref:aspartate--tRNA ligase, mitochondrial-like n=1 Tax=Pollicipes pollicipes TaxID=41117 RepID=UPI0018856A35|nr:aspartate--tRNA ligase, mitochondrial-like [Pollicipes pollicipes]